METEAVMPYLLMSALIIITGGAVCMILAVQLKARIRAQNYFFSRSGFSNIRTARSSTALSHKLFSSEILELQWGDIIFYDKECGFPVMQVNVCNTGRETVMIERGKFNIWVVGRLRNRVEGHSSLSIMPWSYTVQFDPLFEGSGTVVDLAAAIQPHTGIQLLFTIGQETSDVETPTLYRFDLQLEDSNNRKLICKPLTIAIPSPVRAKSYAMLEERAHVIAQNDAVIRTFSSFTEFCNPLAQRILRRFARSSTGNRRYSL